MKLFMNHEIQSRNYNNSAEKAVNYLAKSMMHRI